MDDYIEITLMSTLYEMYMGVLAEKVREEEKKFYQEIRRVLGKKWGKLIICY